MRQDADARGGGARATYLEHEKRGPMSVVLLSALGVGFVAELEQFLSLVCKEA